MGQNKVRDIMTADLVTLSPNNTVREATKKLAVENNLPFIFSHNHFTTV